MYRAGGDPALRPVGETEFVNGTAAMSASGVYGPARACAGIVGHADLRLGGGVRPVLEAHIAASGGRFRGVRHIAAFHTDEAVRSTTLKYPPGLLADAGFREGFAVLGAMGLTYDTWLYHTQLPELIDLARASSGTTIVLDHVGGMIGVGPYAERRDEAFAEWRASICELARSEQVVVKLGGLGMRLFGFGFHERERPPGSHELADAWRPYVETCIEAFGPRRCMFESNFPVDKGACSYGVLWNAFKRLAAGSSPEEKAALFHDTASRVYRLGETA
jgi:predicted TIM-barrel fold metal-dependent hydrolase